MEKLDIETMGSGPDLVLLHSLLTDRSSFAALADRLSPQRRLTLVNLPGFGKSPPAEPLAGWADRVADLCAALPSTKPDILGNGLGSFVAMTMAARHGANLGRIVLLGGAVAFPEAGRATFRGLAEKAEREGMASIADIAVARMFPEDFVASHADVVADRREVFSRIDPAVFAAAARSLSTLDFSAELTRIVNPVLIVVGEKDSATPPALGRELAGRLLDCRIVELPGIGHAPHIHAPDLLMDTLRPFLGLR